MSDKIKKGKEGEMLAADFLVGKGFEIVERNYRHKRSEIDLIVKKNNWLIFVEVKMRSSDAYGYPEDFVDYKKAKNIIDGAEEYTYQQNWQGNVRYDIVSIREQHGEREIVHIEDAFYRRRNLSIFDCPTHMIIERSKKNKLTITVSSSIDSYGLQRLIDYAKYLEATSKSKARQSDVDKLADEVNASWWAKNKKRFIR